MKMFKSDRRTVNLLLLGAALLVTGCPSKAPSGPRLAENGTVQVAIVIPTQSATGLQAAAQDLADAMGTITGATAPAQVVLGDPSETTAPVVVWVRIDANAVGGGPGGNQCFAVRQGALDATDDPREGLVIRAPSEAGAAYGLYRVAMDLGVLWLHPEESFYPDAPGARLPWRYDDSLDCPRFARRGFHEHTQHPIVSSDFLLRPGDPTLRDQRSRYIRWLARNRQNFFSFMLLKTVDVDAWVPYMADAVAEAHDRHVDVGVVVSFVDQQQNSFKLISGDATGMTDQEQIVDGLDTILGADFDQIIFQIGSSEFTKPADATQLGRLNFATAHLRDRGVDAAAWIHTTCSLLDEQGGYFFHLPLQADADLEGWVHTVMFHDLEHPAPVYDCEDFSQQVDFLTAASGERRLTYFPETAWWLGFDNNLPLVLPITNWSRAHDIQQVLGSYDVWAHVTFTSGREWTYWQYDHFLTRITWDDEISPRDYLDWVAPLYAGRGSRVAEVLDRWTQLQVEHFFETNPLIYFYLAGELPQDEIGAAAGILARRPKLNYNDVLRYDDAQLATWQTTDYELLGHMREDYQRLLNQLDAEPPGNATGLQQRLYREVYRGLWVYVRRIEHALALYAGVVAARTWDQEVRRGLAVGEDPDLSLRDPALAEAELQLANARSISQTVLVELGAAEGDYRYPIELLARAKPESPTSYKFGYLEQTSTGFFWTRRDDQLDTLIARVFQTVEESWTQAPDAFWVTYGDLMQMTEPESDLAAGAIAGFIPQLLFAVNDFDAGAQTATLVLAQDFNENRLPDPGSEQAMDLVPTTDSTEFNWQGVADVYTFVVHDSSGAEMGGLTLIAPILRLRIVATGNTVDDLAEGELSGDIASQTLVDMIVSIGGIDEAGASALVKAVYDLPAGEPLPPTLPFAFRMTYDPAL